MILKELKPKNILLTELTSLSDALNIFMPISLDCVVYTI